MDGFKTDMRERAEREEYFKSLTPDKIKSFTENDLLELVSRLWSRRGWGNKNYLVQNLIAKNGLDKLQKALLHLLWGKDPIEERYEKFLSQIKGLGPASVTEILSSAHPTECGIWNDRSRQALEKLGLNEMIPVKKYQITAEEYKNFNDILCAIIEELKKAGFQEADLFFADYFLFEVFRQTETGAPEEQSEEFDHNEIRDMIQQIGLWLGFDIETEKGIARGAVVDCVWQTKIGNLGVVTYVFEVHNKGSIDSLIVNLQKAIGNATVQKVVAVTNYQQIERIKGEIERLPENFRKALIFWDVADVKKVYKNLEEVSEIITRLELVPSGI